MILVRAADFRTRATALGLGPRSAQLSHISPSQRFRCAPSRYKMHSRFLTLILACSTLPGLLALGSLVTCPANIFAAAPDPPMSGLFQRFRSLVRTHATTSSSSMGNTKSMYSQAALVGWGKAPSSFVLPLSAALEFLGSTACHGGHAGAAWEELMGAHPGHLDMAPPRTMCPCAVACPCMDAPMHTISPTWHVSQL